jgi:predicted secreted protein
MGAPVLIFKHFAVAFSAATMAVASREVEGRPKQLLELADSWSLANFARGRFALGMHERIRQVN